MKRVLLIGLLPSAVDFSSLASSAFPDLTPEKLFLSFQAQEKSLHDLGFELTHCLVDAGETAEAVTLAALQARTYDVVVIGAGVRTLPAHFMLFEKLLNLVHEHAPKARICFNTRPEDTQAAILRWVDARAISG